MRGWGQPQQGATEGWGRVGGVLHAWVTCSGHGLTWACSQGCVEPSPAPPPGSHPAPFRGRAGLPQGRGGRWAAGGPQALIPGSSRFPQIDSLLTFFFQLLVPRLGSMEPPSPPL